MKATLIIPRLPTLLGNGQIVNSKAIYRFPLRWTDHHPASQYGLGVVLSPNNEVFDGFMFRHLRDTIDARIESDDPDRIRSALGIPGHETGIISTYKPSQGS